MAMIVYLRCNKTGQYIGTWCVLYLLSSQNGVEWSVYCIYIFKLDNCVLSKFGFEQSYAKLTWFWNIYAWILPSI